MDSEKVFHNQLDVTKRKVLLKLELSGDIPSKLQAVAGTVYGIGLPLTQPAEDNTKWKTTDEVLYAEAKRSYDEILTTFNSEPKVYKFESTKEFIWKRNKEGGGLESPPKPTPLLAITDGGATASPKERNRAYWDRRAKHRRDAKPPAPKVPLTEAELSATFIDPFQTVSKAGEQGDDEEPVEVWHQKLEMLKQLTPREDLEGYEIREDYHMQQARLAAQADFQRRMKLEVQRREEWPTEIEQVEDVLYDVVDAICRNLEAAEKAHRVAAKRRERGVWHPAAAGFKMKPLGSIVSESGVETAQVSDFPFTDFMISPTGRMLAVRAPPELFELHDQERRARLEAELRRLEAEELERKRPLTDKLRIAVAMARHDPAAAAQKAASDVLERAVRWPRAVSERLLHTSRQAIAQGLAGLVQASADPQTALEELSSSLVRSYRNMLKRSATALSSPAKKRPRSGGKEPSIKDVEAIIDDAEQQAQQREELLAALHRASMGVADRPPVPVHHVDAVQLTMTLLVSPPPAYTMRPPPSWRRDLVKAKKRMLGELHKRSRQASSLLHRAEESDAVYVLNKLAKGMPLKQALRSDVSKSDKTLAAGRPASSQAASVPGRVAEEEAVVEQDSSLLTTPSLEEQPLKPSAVRAASSQQRRVILGNGRRAPPALLPEALPQRAGMSGSGEDSFEENSSGAEDGPEEGGGQGAEPGLVTPRSARSRSRRASQTGASPGAVAENHPLEDEELHVERLRLKRGYRGRLEPEDMIPKAFKDYHGKLVFDTSERAAFEQALVAEIADAVGLPIKNISIEEIRRLEVDDPRLYELQRQKAALMDLQRQTQQEASDRQLALQRAKKEYLTTLEKLEGLPADSPLIAYDLLPAASTVGALSRATTESPDGGTHSAGLQLTSAVAGPPSLPVAPLYLLAEGGDSPTTGALAPAEGVGEEEGDRSPARVPHGEVPVFGISLPAQGSHEIVAGPLELAIASDASSQVAQDEDEGRGTAGIGSFIDSVTPAEGDQVSLPDDSLPRDAAAGEQDAPQGSLIEEKEDDPFVSGPSFPPRTRKSVTFEGDLGPSMDLARPMSVLLSLSVVGEDTVGQSSEEPVKERQAHFAPEDRSEPTEAQAGCAGSRDSSMSDSAEEVLKIVPFELASDSGQAEIGVRELVPFGDSLQPDSQETLSELQQQPEMQLNDASLAVTRSQPVRPALFQVGIPNPDEARRDPSHWLAKSLGDLQAEERRQYRIQRLLLLRKEDDLQRRLRQLRAWRDELVEDAVDTFAPVAERLQPLVDRAAPVVDSASRQALVAARSGLAVLQRIAKNYVGPKLANIAHFRKIVKRLQVEVKALATARLAKAGADAAGDRAPTRPSDGVRAVPAAVLEVMGDMLEEIEYRAVEDEVEAVLQAMCAAVEGAAEREQVSQALSELCAAVATAATVAEEEERNGAEEKRRTEERRAATAPALVPLEETAPSEYDFAQLTRHLNMDALSSGSARAVLAREGKERDAGPMGDDSEAEDEDEVEDDDEGEEAGEEDGKEVSEDMGSEEDGEDYAEGEEGDNDEQHGEGAESEEQEEGEDQAEVDEGEEEANYQGGDSEIEDGEDGEKEPGEEEEDEEEEEDGSDELDDDDDMEDEAEMDEDEDEDEDGEGERESDREGSGSGSVGSQLQNRLREVDAVEAELAVVTDSLAGVSEQLRAVGQSEGDGGQDGDAAVRQEVAALLGDLCLRVEVRLVLDEVCEAVRDAVDAGQAEEADEASLFRDLSEMDMSGICTVASSQVADLALAERLVGCEVTFMIYVGPEQRQLDGLADIEAEDIAVMLKQQLYDPTAPLQGGKYTSAALEVRSKVAHKRQRFEKWESFYAHIIHPSFFGYSTKKPLARAPVTADEDGLINGRLQSGVVPVNPTQLFGERSKETFQELSNRPVLRPPWERVRKEAASDDDEASVGTATRSAASAEGKQKEGLDLNVDEFAQDVRRLKLYRPNMAALTAKDVQRLKRLHKAFEERYEEEMRKGLVDGKRLRPEQFQALKDKDSAYRIYRTARQKFKHVNKHFSDELVLPPLEVTRIDHATFDGWVQEVKAEDHQRLREARVKAAKRKKVLEQEAQLRRLASQKRLWIVDTFVGACESPLDVGHAFEEQMLKAEVQREFLRQKEEAGAEGSAADKVLRELQEQQRSFKQALISEEKKTRKLFEFAVRWARRKDGVLSLPQSPQSGARPSAGLNPVADSIPIMAVFGPSAEADTASGLPADANLKRIGTAESRVTRSSVETGGDEAPSLRKADLHEYVAMLLRALERDDRRQARQTRRTIRQSRLAEKQRRMESLQAFQAKTSAKGKSGGLQMQSLREGANGESGEEDEEDDSSDEGLEDTMSSPSPSPPPSPVRLPLSPSAAPAASFSFLPPEQELGDEEVRALRELQWVRTVAKYPQFRKCLAELPTLDDTSFARDELVQFAGVLCEVEPVFAKVLAELDASKEATEVAMGLRRSKAMEAAFQAKQRKQEREEKKRQRRQAKEAAGQAVQEAEAAAEEAAERALADRLHAEQQKALEAVARKAEREKAWYMAHPHKFIRHPGETAFCIVCKEKETEFWMKTHKEGEQQWRDGFDAHVQERIDGQEQHCKEAIESELRAVLSCRAAALVAEDMAAEERQRAEEGGGMRLGRSFNASKLSPLKLLHAATKKPGELAASATPSATALAGEEEEQQVWPRELARISAVIRSAGLSLVDARGKSVLPKKPPKRAAAVMFIPPVVQELPEDPSEAGALGLRLRVWHRDGEGNRANFLGSVTFREKDMVKPPKGMRSYPLHPDDAVVEREPLPVSGSLVVLLRRSGEKHPRWRLEVVRAAGLCGVVDRGAKADPASGVPPAAKPPNCFVEAYWKGFGQKGRSTDPITEWTLVGHTATKQHSENPLFDKEADGGLMELPPVWTDHPVPRSHFEDHVQEEGGWVPRNQVPEPPAGESDGEAVLKAGHSAKRPGQQAGSEKRFPYGAKSEEEVVQFRTVMKYNELVKAELQTRLEALRYLYAAEERERKFMAQEERQRRAQILDRELERSQTLVVKQTEFSRSFMRLLRLVQAPPNILARLRFLMGEDSRGGGQKVMCEDPATGKIFHVVATPILRKEDEGFMLEQLNKLFTAACPNLVRIVDFSVHQLRDFTDRGFSSTDERMAIAVLDYIEGCTVMHFVQRNWETLTNDAFREILCQIVGALRAMHRCGVIHRNFHPEAIVMELPHSRAEIKKRTGTGGTAKAASGPREGSSSRKTGGARLLNEMVVCYLGDYWFLHNPRAVACESSVGRADWGAPMTVPPEAVLAQYGASTSAGRAAAPDSRDQTLSRIAQVEARRSASAGSLPEPTRPSFARTQPVVGSAVTDKSDMYAFGLCLYYWATNGLHRSLPLGPDGFVDLAAVKRNLPLKWKPWLHSLVDMCLQVRPENRASSKDVHLFLSSRFGK